MLPEESEANPDRLEHPFATSTMGFGDLGVGAVIGPYHLLQRIGEGGMGEVWLAEQKQPVRRSVAVKLIKTGMNTREVVARFESERQALALMDHPAIAKVFDAGSTADGRPYFVMEYVAGIHITDYCDKHKLTTRQRLELFILVCEGVQHAHQKAIVHRDLKPSNILVSEVDGRPMPRIIDFGVAKATSQRLTAETMYTRVGTIVGTLGYMSPEQADSTGEDIDTRTDVYSLGVVLYELLAGTLPFDFKKLAYDEVLRRLREQDAQRPSLKLRTLGGESAITAQNRGADVPTLVRQLRGDADAIALKALEKDRARRYATPSELAADIGRYLRNEPVVARPASAAYLARKYIRRHRFGVAAAASAVFLLVSFAAVQAFQLQRTTRERDRATRERNRADRITEFMTGMFKVSDPSTARGNSITAREILDKASKEIDPGLSKDPELQAQMMHVMGQVYLNLGLFFEAQSLLTRAVEIRRRVLGPQHPDTLYAMSTLAGIYDTRGNYAAARKLQREGLDIRRRVLGPTHPDTLLAMAGLANGLTQYDGHYAEAEKLTREALDGQRRIFGAESVEILASSSLLAQILDQEGRYTESEKLSRETLDIDHRVFGPDDDDVALKSELARSLANQGRYAEAEKLEQQALDYARRGSGPDNRPTFFPQSVLADILAKEGRYSEAEKEYLELADLERRVYGSDHPETSITIYNLGVMAGRKGNREKALSLLREAVDHGLPPRAGLIMGEDPDLKSLHGDLRFDKLVAYAKERATIQAQKILNPEQ